MRVGMEARWITFEKTGFGNYALHLLRNLAKIDKQNDYLVYLNNNYDNSEIFSSSNFERIILNRRPEFYKHISIPLDIIAKKRKIDFFHFLYNAPSLFMPCPFILTVHDVSYRHIPNMISKKDLISINVQMTINAKKAAKLITDSENSKKDIVNFLGISEEKIEVIYLGVDDNFRPMTEEHKKKIISDKYQLPSNFILYVGTYLPHKNIETLLHAFKDLKEEFRISHSLVLAGKQGRNFDSISSLIHKLDLKNFVYPIGFVQDEDLPYLYNLSELFVFPSRYEGFGLPLLEAMACGVPVISSNASCLPEIAGDCALYFSPDNRQELTKCIHELITNNDLRNQFIERGINRAKLFTWEKMAARTFNVYEDVYKTLYNKPH